MSGFTITTTGDGSGVGGGAGGTGGTTQFGELAIAELVPQSQAIFTYGINPLSFITASNGSGSSISANNSIMTIESGNSSAGYAQVKLRRGLKYRAGQGALVRMTAIFGTPYVDSKQLAGYGNSEAGFYFGYKNLDFGIFHQTDGQVEIRKLTITSAVSSTTNVIITLDGQSITVPIAGGGTIKQTSWEISQKDYTKVGPGWLAEAHDGYITFICMKSGPRTGSFTATAPGPITVGTFTTVKTGISITENFVSQSNWNVDRLDGVGPSGMLLNKQLGNVYQIGFQYLGFGNTRFFVENPETGTFQLCHMIKQANVRTRPVLKDPHVSALWEVENNGSTSNLIMSGASAAIFNEGQVLRNIGPSFSIAAKKTSLAKDVETPIVSIRSDRVLNDITSHGEIDVNTLAITITDNGTATRRVTIRIYKNARLSGPVDFTKINSVKSCASYDTAATSAVLNDGVIVATYVTHSRSGFLKDLSGDNFFLATGETLTITAEASDTTDEVAVALSWFEDQ